MYESAEVIGFQKQANGKCYLRSIKCTISGVQFPGVTKLTERLFKLLPRREKGGGGGEGTANNNTI